jgi:hypothetical protein
MSKIATVIEWNGYTGQIRFDESNETRALHYADLRDAKGGVSAPVYLKAEKIKLAPEDEAVVGDKVRQIPNGQFEIL